MARRPREISVYDRISDVQDKIAQEEAILSDLRSQLGELEKEKELLEMNQIWTLIKERGLSLEEVQNLISNK